MAHVGMSISDPRFKDPELMVLFSNNKTNRSDTNNRNNSQNKNNSNKNGNKGLGFYLKVFHQRNIAVRPL